MKRWRPAPSAFFTTRNLDSIPGISMQKSIENMFSSELINDEDPDDPIDEKKRQKRAETGLLSVLRH